MTGVLELDLEERANVSRLSKDILKATASLSAKEARYLIDYYYLCQEDRKRANNQVRAMGETEEPSLVVNWLAEQATTLEHEIKKALERYTNNHPVGAWLKTIYGIGPVIAASMLAHIDITKAPTVGHIWRYAGLDPTCKWEKGQKRPWNASLKVCCYYAGISFLKFSNREECVYGKIYRDRKNYEIMNNEALKYAEQADEGAAKVAKTTDAYSYYSIGKLPPAHIDARARRYSVKRFLSDLHCAWYWIELKQLPPKPFVIQHLGHSHYEYLPVFDSLPGLTEALISVGAMRVG